LSKFENDLSQGSVIKKLLAFAIPFIISNLIQSLYNVIDMIIVGQFSGTASMSGVNIGGQATLLVTNIVVGLCAGATVLIGQYKGSGARKELEESIATLFTTLLIAAVILTVAMIVLRVPLLRAINTPEEAFDEANDFLLITALGTIFIFGYNAFSAVMRGMGDSRSPLIFVAIACGITVVLDLLFVALLGMRAAGAALATIIAQAISMILCIVYFKKNAFPFDFKLKSFTFHKKRLRMLMKIGIPTSVQNVVVNLSFLFLTALVNSWGVTASAALGAVGKFNSFAILPAIAMSASVAAMSAQNIGAGQEKRALRTMQYGILIAAGMSFSIFALTRLFPTQILEIFADDPGMIEAGLIYLNVFSYDYILAPFLFCINGLFIGAGHTTFSLLNGIMSSLLVRVPAAYLLGMVAGMGLAGVGLGAPLASGAALIVAVIFFLSGKWKRLTIIGQG